MTAQGFQDALRRLMDDEEFAVAVQEDPDKLTSTYTLSEEELHVLASVWRVAHPSEEVTAAAMVVVACYVACKAA